ncbi:MAG: ATPase, partial [Butyrivibrio sp.]|nr:ATPase [Butyrivibrio sp.]
TTLCGNAILNNIANAKKEGYLIEVHYIGLSSVELAKERVAKRVSEGGHGVNASDIERRSSCKKITQSSRLV